jgi:hypothetical protein
MRSKKGNMRPSRLALITFVAVSSRAEANGNGPSWIAAFHLDDVGDMVQDKLPNLQDNLRNTWSMASETVQNSAKSMQNPVQQFVGGFFDVLRTLILPLSNLVYVTVMLYGFRKLPANFMLVAGVLTLFVGPLLAGWVMRLLAAGISTAAYAPFIIVFAAWLVVFLKSALFQRLALAMGLDRDGDGDVDAMDMLKWCSDSRAGRWMQLPMLHAHLSGKASLHSASIAHLSSDGARQTVGQLQSVLVQLDRMESMLNGIAKGGAPKDTLPLNTGMEKAGVPSRTAASGGFFGLPAWASPQGSESFASKQRAKLAKQQAASNQTDLV